jgi:2-polyprenyl-3-methyl-5-hydroxy-6-metoxy-1,4-benzoquinol methylase
MDDKYESYYMRDNIEKHRIISRYVKAGKVLDLGFAHCPNPFVKNMVGLDVITTTNIPSNYVETIQFDLNKGIVPYKDGTFDTVLACDVVEHLNNPQAIIDEVKRVLKPNGVLIISVPNPYNINEVLTNIMGWYKKEKYRDRSHKQSFNPNNMLNLLEAPGFKITKILGYRIKLPLTTKSIINKHVPAMLSTQTIYICRKDTFNTNSVK